MHFFLRFLKDEMSFFHPNPEELKTQRFQETIRLS